MGPWGRARCSLLQPNAPACKAGGVSTRYFLRFRDTPKLGVARSNRARVTISFLRGFEDLRDVHRANSTARYQCGPGAPGAGIE